MPIAWLLATPAALAHERIDFGPRAAQALAAAASSEDPAAWDGLPVADEAPATTALIASDLAALPRVTREDVVRFGARSVPRRVLDTIVRASTEAGVDPVYMMALADTESRFSTDARADTSSAQGLFQFVTATWLEMIRDFGARYGLIEEAAAVTGRGGAITVSGVFREWVLALRNDPRMAAPMAAELVKRDRARIEAKVGRALSATELYRAHLLGGAGVERFPSCPAGGRMCWPGGCSAVRPAPTATCSRKAGGRRRDLTVAELHGRIANMIGARLDRYRGVAALAGAAARQIESTAAAAPEGE